MAGSQFGGHILSGSFFIVFGCWWMTNLFYRFFNSEKQKVAYTNTTTFPFPFSSRCIPAKAESYLKIVAGITLILAELFNGFAAQKGFGRSGNLQHMSVYFFFGMNGIIEVSNYKKWNIPAKLDYLSLALSFGVEAFVLYHHLHGRSPMNLTMHMFLFYTIFACFVACLFEMVLETNVVPALFRAFFTLLQGTWLYQIAFTLYSPFGEKWDEYDHGQVMILPPLFLLHFVVLLLFTVVIGAVVRAFVLKSDRKFTNEELVSCPCPTTNIDLDLSEEQQL